MAGNAALSVYNNGEGITLTVLTYCFAQKN
jgi:hypothetical protein